MNQLELVPDDHADVASRPPPPPPLRGFAAMDPEKVRAIASKGGRAAHAIGAAHRFTPEEARAAGKKGGNAPHARWGRKKR